ncbi:MAG: bifunctional (p)ppGpp synthetase/guanosine-3',5'-bis(diphosphate) 3'-pyrophosphohydrolase [Deltaproteobacteria bacterium]|nr:bifunctional (p)ppGpp synthetase/guanosine-3',5'-bis(diphosphate) 3'-pyrophosphohydrolase [Deltaproteobacteria bacterium]
MPELFLREKEQILSQYILHHEVGDAEVADLSDRLDVALQRATELHTGQKRKTGEDYIWHPVRTAMEVSRFGRIIDWASVEAAILHDTLEDTPYTFASLQNEFPDAANLVLALTKIKDSRALTYHKLFRYVLQDIRVLLVKLADRLDNLETLPVFKREKQVRIARESAEMYANICRRLCMNDLAERLTAEIGPILTPEVFDAFQAAQAELRDGWSRPIEDLRTRLAEIFPGDMGTRIEVRWNRFRPELLPLPENLLAVRIVTETSEDAYRALGRVHMAFRPLPGAFVDTLSAPSKNGYRSLETRVAYQGRILTFCLASRSADRFNRLGLLAMDITSPQFNLEYLDDLREFLENEEMDIQEFLRFHRPDAIQVISPKGDVYSLEEGATALDFAFAVHEKLGLRALSARINGTETELSTVLRPGDRVEVVTGPHPAADDRYLTWSHTRKAQSALRRYMKRLETERAEAMGQQWLLDAAQAQGLSAEAALERARARARERRISELELLRRICLGTEDIGEILGAPPGASGVVPWLPRPGLLHRWRGRDASRRKVRRYEFQDPHLRFCPRCAPVEGDEIEGAPEEGRLLVHRTGCPAASGAGRVPLAWEHGLKGDLWDPGPVDMELTLRDGPGVLYTVLAPFKELGLDLRNLRLPGPDHRLHAEFQPGSDRTLNRLIRSLRRAPVVEEIRLFRPMEEKGRG